MDILIITATLVGMIHFDIATWEIPKLNVFSLAYFFYFFFCFVFPGSGVQLTFWMLLRPEHRDCNGSPLLSKNIVAAVSFCGSISSVYCQLHFSQIVRYSTALLWFLRGSAKNLDVTPNCSLLTGTWFNINVSDDAGNLCKSP